MRFGGLELLIILAIILLIFGPKQIPKLTKTLKQSAKEIKEGLEEEEGASTVEATEVDKENKEDVKE